MRKWFLASLLAASLHGAVVRGVVVENQSGRPLSRASILLEPLPGSPGLRMTTHTNQFGAFELAGMPAGMYLLQASRVAFLTTLYGQKRWNSAGKPLQVMEEKMPYLTIRLLRFSSIAGTVADENDVGMAQFEVLAYLNTRPPQVAGKTTADEQGHYRIYGLLPGTYIVRTASKQVEEEGYKPTFAKETELFDQAREVEVGIEEQANLINVRPLPGKLFSLTASAIPTDPDDAPTTLTFASEMGRQIIRSPGGPVSRVFPGLVPGDYQVFGEAPTDGTLLQSEFQRLSLGRDSGVSLTLVKTPAVSFSFDGVPLQTAKEIKVMARRKDLAGTYDYRTLTGTSAVLPAGIWEFALPSLDGYYVAGFSGSGPYYRRPFRTDGWNEITVTSRGGGARFSLSRNVSTLHGIVTDAGEPVVGAPVFLEPVDLEPERRITFATVVITDIHGQYKYNGLAPGKYRLLSTFEFQMPNSKEMIKAGAREVTLEPHSDVTRELSLYVIQ